ncbi:hypothetical protein SCUCBS95973_002121 [Sporothrix curviconia]|uniref:Uncharacterized protein n=1 Tax=Sporothrix curviconia TaxID=1260050 RepID=A0ABP0B4B7_9PEZI
MYSARGRPALSDCDEEETELSRRSYAAEEQGLPDEDEEPYDPVAHLGQGMPPYNFDLFSEVSSKYAPENSSYSEQSAPRGDFYNGEDINKLFSGTSSFYGSYNYGNAEQEPPGRRHRFDDDPIVPDYNFDLFSSDETNRWSPSPPAGRTSSRRSSHSGRASTGKNIEDSSLQPSRQTLLVVRRRSPLCGEDEDVHGSSPAGSAAPLTDLRHMPTMEVEEYDGTDDETNNSYGVDGTQTLVSTAQRMIDCEVISNPEEADERGFQNRGSSVKCRASIRTFETAC